MRAYEVLADDEQRELYDYYLEHPSEYYKVSGRFYFKQLPDADIRVIVLFFVLFFSVLLPVVQYQRYQVRGWVRGWVRGGLWVGPCCVCWKQSRTDIIVIIIVNIVIYQPPI